MGEALPEWWRTVTWVGVGLYLAYLVIVVVYIWRMPMLSIDHMEPGPQLDALLAREVMGGADVAPGWSPSTNEADAYSVAAIARDLTPDPDLPLCWVVREERGEWVAGWRHGDDWHLFARADDAKLAICRAALKTARAKTRG